MKAELAQAAKDGTLEVNNATYPVVADTVNTKIRAQVQRDLPAYKQLGDTVVMQD